MEICRESRGFEIFKESVRKWLLWTQHAAAEVFG
jgi:hypothetical protein